MRWLTAVLFAVAVVLASNAWAQSANGRGLGPAEVRELRSELRIALSNADVERGVAAAARRRAETSRSNLERVGQILGVRSDAPLDEVLTAAAGWVEQDLVNRDQLAGLKLIVGRIDAGAVRDGAEHYLQAAQEAFEDGRLQDADQALSQLAVLRSSSQTEARELWAETVLARSTLADQRLDGETARRFVREARAEERALSNRTQLKYLLREVDSYVQDDARQTDNTKLAAALELFEKDAPLLVDRERDRLSYAEFQLSYGRVLATLGHRELASTRLSQAIVAFQASREAYGPDAPPATRAAISDHTGTVFGFLGERTPEPLLLEQSIAAHRQAVAEQTREEDLHAWGVRQSNLAGALAALGSREPTTTRLEEAVTVYRSALHAISHDTAPLAWANAQGGLGGTLQRMADREIGTARLEEAAAAFREAQSGEMRDQDPMGWATRQNNLGNVLATIGLRGGGQDRLVAAVEAYRSAMEVFTPAQRPLDWAGTQNNLGHALSALGSLEHSPERYEGAIAAYRAALEVQTREISPLDWALTQQNLGTAMSRLAGLDGDIELLEAAIEPLQSALEVRTRDQDPIAWGGAQSELANALFSLGLRETSPNHLVQAVEAYRQALQERTQERAPGQWSSLQDSLASALVSLGDRTSQTEHYVEAIAAYRSALEERDRNSAPVQWARSSFGLGNALFVMGSLDEGSVRLLEARIVLRNVAAAYAAQGNLRTSIDARFMEVMTLEKLAARTGDRRMLVEASAGAAEILQAFLDRGDLARVDRLRSILTLVESEQPAPLTP